MNSKIGRPTESKKDTVVKIRADENTVRMLSYCSKVMNKTKSEVIRTAIESLYEKVKEKGDNKCDL